MSETQTIQTDSASHQRNVNRIAQDEEDLKALFEQQGLNEPSEDTPEEVQEEVQERKAETQETEPDLSAEEKNFKKRYGDLRRHVQDKEQEWKDRFDKLEGQLSAAAKNELVLPKSEHDIEAWAKKYPDVAGIVEAIADKKAQERSADLDGRLKEIEDLRVVAKREKAEAELSSMHPDFSDIRKDDAFHDWAEDQPKWVQDALYENTDDAKSVSRVIDLYKSDKGITTKGRNKSDKEAASSVTTKRTASPNHDESSNYFRESQVAKMSIKEYEKRMGDITEAQRQGKFIYDMSKK
jgi:hypothetical protein|tara:strand:- start:156 stop:1040 length:885 start_codon:yes stop_codon:yes gene_type:complete